MISNSELQKLLRAKGYSGEEIFPMMIRTRLLLDIKAFIGERKWTQRQVAEILEVPQPRVSELLNLHIEKFGSELLLKYARKLGLQVKLEITM